MSYAQARLRLGISAVGWWVCLSTLGLWTGWARLLQPHELALIYALGSLPFDLLGGQLLPRLFARRHLGWVPWTLLYLRSLPLHLGLWLGALTSLSWLAQSLSPALALASYALAVVLFWKFQPACLRWQGCTLKVRPFELEAEAADPRFSGGVAGLPWPGREVALLPAAWSAEEAPPGLDQARHRRRYLIASRARSAGCYLALAFNLAVLWKALEVSGGNPGLLVCAATLGSFLGLLVLPSLSRPGVLSADAHSPLPEGWQNWMEQLQEEDPERPLWVETLFHPIPSASLRRRRLAAGWHPWNTARAALVTSWLSASLLSRAVHCNAGRPELWFWPPSD